MFDSGALTVVLSDDGVSVYVGQRQISSFSRVLVRAERGERPSVDVKFGTGGDSEERVRTEEEERVFATLSWVMRRP